MKNPVLAEVTRGPIVESLHTGAYAICNAEGAVIASAGDVEKPVYPRSAIKAFQCLPMIESGAADRYGLTDEEIALCCSSHNGEPEHLRVARSILAKCGATESLYECGAHWPSHHATQIDLARSGGEPAAVHNNCSGKHAGMLAFASHLGLAPAGYVRPDHAVQKAVAKTLTSYCDCDVSTFPMAIDGCSVPTWAIPLTKTALGFARFGASGNNANQRIIAAARAHPFMIAGTGRFDTKVMQAIPRLFIKVGAEGVFCGCISHAGLGFALKIDDGATRGAEVAIAKLLSQLDVWTEAERTALRDAAHASMHNWRKIEVGEVRATA